jgi:hypothetical protein
MCKPHLPLIKIYISVKPQVIFNNKKVYTMKNAKGIILSGAVVIGALIIYNKFVAPKL